MPELTDIINQEDLIDNYKTSHSNTKEYILLEPHTTFSKTDHPLRQKASLNRHKETEITLCILPDWHGLKLDISNKNNRKPKDSWN